MADAEAAVRKGFEEQLSRLLVRHQYLLDPVDRREAYRLGAKAAEAALAPLIWGQAMGRALGPGHDSRVLGPLARDR